MYVCTYVCMYVCMYVYMYVYMYMFACIYVCTYICMYTSLYVDSRSVHQDTVKKSLRNYNRVIREKYVTPDNCAAANSEFQGQIESAKNVCKLYI